MRKFLYYGFLSISGLLVLVLAVALIFVFRARSQETVSPANVPPARFDAKALLAVSDVDMPASAYLDNRLSPLENAKDTMNVIVDETGAPRIVATAEALNSVMAWPSVVEVSPDGKFAYVAELYGPAPDKSEAVQDIYQFFPKGKRIKVFDVSDPANPRAIGSVETLERPTGLQVSPDGRHLAVSIQDEMVDLQMFRLENGMPVDPITLNFDVRFDMPRYDGAPVHVRWSPDGKVLAVNYSAAGIAFVEPKFDADGRITGGALKGEPVTLTDSRWLLRPLFSVGRFTNNGKFFVVSEVGWGNIFDATGNGWIAPTNGRIVSIKMDSAGGQHSIASQTEVGASPEAIEFSPDGKHLAVVNMENSIEVNRFPYTLSARKYSSLSLVSIDQESGQLATIGKPLRFDGVLPEDAVFDSDGDMLAVVVFHEKGDKPQEGWVEYFKFDKSGSEAKFLPTGVKVKVTRGAHDLAVIY